MTKIRCIENMNRLKEMLLSGEKGDADYFSARLGISRRTFYRLLKYIEKSNDIKVGYNRTRKTYYLE